MFITRLTLALFLVSTITSPVFAAGSHDHAHAISSQAPQRAKAVWKADRPLKAGQPASLEINIVNKETNKPFTRFAKEHEKEMHLILVSEDLQSFAHLHPELAGGRFRLGLNPKKTDADNQDAGKAISKEGRYLAFGEVVPVGEGPQQVRFSLDVGQRVTPAPFKPDEPDEEGAIAKFLDAKGSTGKIGDRYQGTLRYHKMGKALHVMFDLQAIAKDGTYQDVKNLQTWLGMSGHSILIGRAGDRVEDRKFQHLHPNEESNGPSLNFLADPPPSGDYRLWVQVKHNGQILTFPYSLRL